MTEKVKTSVVTHGDGIVIDLGNSGGDAAVIGPGHWSFEDGAAGGSLFRRTAASFEAHEVQVVGRDWWLRRRRGA